MRLDQGVTQVFRLRRKTHGSLHSSIRSAMQTLHIECSVLTKWFEEFHKTYSMQLIHSLTWNPIFSRNLFCTISWSVGKLYTPPNFLIVINQFSIAHELIVHTQRSRTFESLHFPTTLTVYCSSPTIVKVDTNDTTLLSLHWLNKISLTGFYLVKHPPHSPLFKHIISKFQPFQLVLIVTHDNTLYLFKLQHYKQFWCTVSVVHVQFTIVTYLGCYYGVYNGFLCSWKIPYLLWD